MRDVLIYLAHPIDLATGDMGARDWAYSLVCEAKAEMHASPVAVYDPEGAFQVGVAAEPRAWIGQINRAALNRADGVLAVLPEAIVSVGTPIEMHEAFRQGKPVAVVTDIEQSWMLESYQGRRFQVFPASVHGVRQAVGWLLDQETLEDRTARKASLYAEKLTANSQLPTQGYQGDAGFDLFVSESVTVPAKSFIDVPCGVAVELPEGMWAMITGRSSTLRDHGLLVTQGIIDNGYRGPLFAGTWNLTDEDVKVEDGWRLAQLIPFYTAADHVLIHEAPFLAPSERGSNGFGSTGR